MYSVTVRYNEMTFCTTCEFGIYLPQKLSSATWEMYCNFVFSSRYFFEPILRRMARN